MEEQGISTVLLRTPRVWSEMGVLSSTLTLGPGRPVPRWGLGVAFLQAFQVTLSRALGSLVNSNSEDLRRARRTIRDGELPRLTASLPQPLSSIDEMLALPSLEQEEDSWWPDRPRVACLLSPPSPAYSLLTQLALRITSLPLDSNSRSPISCSQSTSPGFLAHSFPSCFFPFPLPLSMQHSAFPECFPCGL